MKAAALILLAVVLPALVAPAARAQERPDTVTPLVVEPEGPSPRAAFLRSIAVPGLGQSMIGSYGRGAFWFAVRTSSYYMLFRSIGRLNDAREIDRRMTGIATDSLLMLIAQDTAIARQLEDPVAFEDAVEAHAGVSRARDLVDTRRRHRQDWIVYTLFFTFLDAVDAFVAAHLADYPIDLSTLPRADGSTELSVRIPLGTRR